MEINLPSVVAEVTTMFERYEAALVNNDVAVLEELFWNDPRVVRYGGSEILYGIDEIRAFRLARPAFGLARELERPIITTFGYNFATACTLFHRETDPSRIGRQTQSWARLPVGWRVVAAHVSLIPL